MRLLVIGGTRFVGWAFVEAATARGHEVTLFHRGVSEPDGFPELEHVHGDRDGGLGPLAGKSWDAALDTCGYLPRVVRASAQLLRDAVGHYTFVSTLSVYADDIPPGANEDSPVHQPPFPVSEEITDSSYGPLKVACEEEVRTAFGERSLIVRPGYIVGPHDTTDRLTSYLRRAAAGGEMLVPGPPEEPVQAVDVRDLGAFMRDRMEGGDPGVYDVIGPDRPITMRDVVETARRESSADTSFTWVSPEFLRPYGEDVDEWLPMWHPQLPGVHRHDGRRAVAAGLRHRPFEVTVRDTLVWDRDRGLPDLRAGLPPEKERALLEAWHSRGVGSRGAVG